MSTTSLASATGLPIGVPIVAQYSALTCIAVRHTHDVQTMISLTCSTIVLQLGETTNGRSDTTTN